MASRLTKSIREALLKKLLQRAFQERAQAHVQRCSEFAVRVYEDALATHLEAIRAIPPGWLPGGDDLKVYVGGDMERLCFNGSMGNGCLTTTLRETGAKEVDDLEGSVPGSFNRPHLPFPAKLRGQCLKQYEAGTPIAEEFTAIKGAQEDLETEISRASRTTSTAMASVTTVPKLIEVWPEVEEFAKHYIDHGERKAILPAIPRAELNAKLGLPPSEAQPEEVAGGTVA